MGFEGKVTSIAIKHEVLSIVDMPFVKEKERCKNLRGEAGKHENGILLLKPSKSKCGLEETNDMISKRLSKHTLLWEKLDWVSRLSVKAHQLSFNQKNENHVNSTHNYYGHVFSIYDAPSVISRWSDTELDQLQNKTLVAEAQEWRRIKREQWEVIQQLAMDGVGQLKFMSNNDFDCMYDLVASRAIGARGDHGNFDNSSDSAHVEGCIDQDMEYKRKTRFLRLVPFLDMAQHCPFRGGQFKYESTKTSESMLLIAGQNTISGEELYLNYGSRPCEEFALQYGFVPNRNPGDGLVFPLGPSNTNVPINRKIYLTWDDIRFVGHNVRNECANYLDDMPSSLSDDVQELAFLQSGRGVQEKDVESTYGDEYEGSECKAVIAEMRNRSIMALHYRIAKKQLLTALAGRPSSSAL